MLLEGMDVGVGEGNVEGEGAQDQALGDERRGTAPEMGQITGQKVAEGHKAGEGKDKQAHRPAAQVSRHRGLYPGIDHGRISHHGKPR